MQQLFHAIFAEILKLRRTLSFWLIILAPAVIAALQMGIILNYGADNYFSGQERNYWENILFNMRSLWIIIMLPLFITLESALLANVEHTENHWKHIFSLPQPRWMTYIAKWIVLAFLTGLATMMLLALTWIVGWALAYFTSSPSQYLSQPFQIFHLTKPLFHVWLIAWLVMAIHTWISLRFHSFTVAVGIGMAAAVSNLILLNSEKALQYDPWLMQATVITDTGSVPLAIAMGVACGLLFIVLGTIDFTRQDVL